MCDGAPNAPSRSSLKAECEVGHQNFFTESPRKQSSGVKMVAVGVAEDDDVVLPLLFSAGARG